MNELRCAWCDRRFPNKTDLNAHEIWERKLETDMMICRIHRERADPPTYGSELERLEAALREMEAKTKRKTARAA